MSNKRSATYAVLAVLAIALVVNLGAAVALGLRRPMASDAFYFRDIARNLASGKGYRQTESLWPGTLTMMRLPGWPFVVAGVFRIAPGADPDLAMRLTAIAVNNAAAAAVALLAVRLFGLPSLGIFSGALYALHPTGIYSTYTGLSEPLFALTMVGGVLLLLSRGIACNMAGFVLVGYACLVRPNYILWGAAAAGIVALLALKRRIPLDRRTVAVGVAGIVLTGLPLLGWAARNYGVCGKFPVVSTIRGQTFYGGNNEVVAGSRLYWGYWVFPDDVPGERKMAELAKCMSEVEIDQYYQGKGLAYIRDNPRAIPMLCLGKLVRGFVPVPWNVTVETLAVSAYRWLLYIASVLGVVFVWRTVDMRYRVAFLGMFLATVATVVWFWGCARFAFAFEPFLIPFAAATAWRLWARKSRAT